jgi:hypothetical protein
VDIWTNDGKDILEHLAGLVNLIVVRAAYRAAESRGAQGLFAEHAHYCN